MSIWSKFDNCVYIKDRGNSGKYFLLLYVDDILLARRSCEEFQKIKNDLKAKFEMKDLGKVKKIRGVDIKRDRLKKKCYFHKVHIQLEKVIRRFFMHEAKSVVTPLGLTFNSIISQS